MGNPLWTPDSYELRVVPDSYRLKLRHHQLLTHRNCRLALLWCVGWPNVVVKRYRVAVVWSMFLSVSSFVRIIAMSAGCSLQHDVDHIVGGYRPADLNLQFVPVFMPSWTIEKPRSSPSSHRRNTCISLEVVQVCVDGVVSRQKLGQVVVHFPVLPQRQRRCRLSTAAFRQPSPPGCPTCIAILSAFWYTTFVRPPRHSSEP